jgi:aerotaxis receptor
VKNLRKDGGYYWVYATVIPKIRDGRIVGHTSVRRQPSRRRVATAAELYASLLADEPGSQVTR